MLKKKCWKTKHRKEPVSPISSGLIWQYILLDREMLKNQVEYGTKKSTFIWINLAASAAGNRNVEIPSTGLNQ